MIKYSTGANHIDWNQLFDLYKIVGLIGSLSRNNDYEYIKAAFLNSFRVVTAWEGKRLVGAGRLISDGVCCGTLFDIGVLPEYRRRGIATGIIKELLAGTENMSIHLTSAFGIEELYTKQGFKRHKNAFAKYPHESGYLENT